MMTDGAKQCDYSGFFIHTPNLSHISPSFIVLGHIQPLIGVPRVIIAYVAHYQYSFVQAIKKFLEIEMFYAIMRQNICYFSNFLGGVKS